MCTASENRGIRKSAFAKSIVSVLFVAVFLMTAQSEAAESEGGKNQDLPRLNPPGAVYHTPLAGEGFRTEIFGHEITVEPRDRRSTSAWDAIVALYEPGPENSEVVPVGVLSFWRHPDDDHLLRAQVAVLYNDIFWSRKIRPGSPFEYVLTWRNYTDPFPQAELLDGKTLDSQELTWGYVRPGIGIGYRVQTSPGHQDSMTAIDLLLEPGYLYFNSGSQTSPAFVVPRDTFTLQAHLMFRMDRLDRNLLELPHRGIAAGADLVAANRSNWQNWGTNGQEQAGNGRSYQEYSGYFLAAGGVPGIESDRHRLIGVVHAGVGHNLDRFSAQRVGGGPNPFGEEYGSTVEPLMHGAVVREFFPNHYLLLLAEYRFEAVFFAYLGFNAGYSILDRLRQTEAGIVSRTDSFPSLGTRLTSGFFFDSRLQLSYNYNFSVVRQGEYGGHELIVNISRAF